MADIFSEMGPLPEGDRQDTLQQLSIKALHSRLPAGKILFRDERSDDKGVDGALEVKFEFDATDRQGRPEVRSRFTNCRAQAQLKSTDSPTRLKDGTVSLSVETSNLNYLLNGQSPIYFLWIAPTDEVRYAWARDEWRRLEDEKPGRMAQGEVTLHFKRVLTPQAVEEIRERIVKEARLEREIHDSLARSSLAERVVVSIDPRTLKSTDPKEFFQRLASIGMTTVSAGYGAEVMEWVGVLNPEDRGGARIQLVAAYAQASLGRYHAAVAHLAEAAMRRTDLPAEDQQFLDYLRDACQFQTGRIDLDEYLRRVQEWASRLGGVAALEHGLERARQERRRERDHARRRALLDDIRAKADAILAAEDATPAHKLQAQIVRVNAEGEDLAARFVEGLTLLRMREGMGLAPGEVGGEVVKDTTTRWEEWRGAADALIEDAAAANHPLLTADALTARLTVRIVLMTHQRLDAFGNDERWELPEAELYALMGDAEQARQIYEKAGNLEGQARAKLLLADLYDFAGQQAAGKALAEGALAVAQAMNYSGLEAHAREHIAGQTMFRRLEARIAQRRQEDQDLAMATCLDADMRDLARDSLAASGLPAERLPMVEREWLSQRDIARERADWCRHLLLVENLKHEQDPSTHFKEDPPRICTCEKHRYTSAKETPDWIELIREFKRVRCAGCPDRDPKRKQAAS